MAVFPDRIVLKNSTDDQATIEAAIATGGTDEITQGEIVLGIDSTDVKFYTKAGNGSIVTLGGTSGGGATSLGQLNDVDLSTNPPTDGQVIAYDSATSQWLPVDQTGGTGDVEEAPNDGQQYARQNEAWSVVVGDVEEAPLDGQQYARQSGSWSVVEPGLDGGLAFWGGGDFTTGTSDGEQADGGLFTV